ncbi:MAG: hypothetical protein FWC89_04080 [Defluviitaleaceae bacterium]|nr:hypothetical protein [Defluviitaleaceae bacterium]
MENEKLIARAEAGEEFDKFEMYNVGLAYFQQNDFAKAAEWWQKAMNAGNFTAGYNLTAIVYRAADFGFANSTKYFVGMMRLAYEFKNGWAQVVLGTMLSGVLHNNWWCGERNGFKKDEFEKYFDIGEGMRLIESGVLLAQSEDSPVKLTHADYGAIAQSYQERFRGGWGDRPRPKEEYGPAKLEYIKLSLEYAEKELAALLESKDPQFYHPEYIKLLEGNIESTKGQYDSLRDALDSM